MPRSLAALRRPLLTTYLVVFMWSIVANGLPIDRLAVLSWMAAAFAISSLGRTRDQVVQMLKDWAVLVVIYMIYDYSRGTADQWGIKVNYTGPRDLDRFFLLGRDISPWLQSHLYSPANIRWYDVLGSLIYMTHFVLPVLPLALLRIRNRPEWIRYVRRFSITLYSAVFCFIVYPAAPPWMAARDGYISPIGRLTGRGWHALHLKTVSKTLDRGAAVVNAVAAMPSLHAGMALFVALWYARNQKTWVRLLALLFPLSMMVTLAYFGEHYIVDSLAGWLLVGFAWQVSNWWERRAAGRESAANLDHVPG